MVVYAGFLRPGKLTLNPRTWVSNIIAKLAKKYSHTFIMIDDMSRMVVRDMDVKGTEWFEYMAYHVKYADRIELYKYRYNSKLINKKEFLKEFYTYRRYDFTNTFFIQLIKVFLRKFIGRDTKWKVMCSEDFVRLFNILSPGYFKDRPDSYTPYEVSMIVSKDGSWENTKIWH